MLLRHCRLFATVAKCHCSPITKWSYNISHFGRWRMNYVLRTTLILASLAALAPAAPAETPRNRPELFARLIDCRTIPDAGQRLDCYDRSVSAIEAAEKSNELVVVDRREIRETKRSLFGFTLPRISLFSGDKND